MHICKMTAHTKCSDEQTRHVSGWSSVTVGSLFITVVTKSWFSAQLY